MRQLRLLSAAAIVLATLVVASPASAATLNVCPACTYTTVKDAVAAAGDGDTIAVDTGTFNETGPIVINKPLTIIGEGKANTIIDGGGTGQAIFEIRPLTASAAGVITIKDLTVRNAGNTTSPIRVLIKNVSTGITGIVLDALDINGTGSSYGMYADGGAKISGVDRAAPPLTVSNSTVHGQANNGLGIDTYRGATTISGNTLSEGTSGRSAILVMNEYTTSRMPDAVKIQDNTATGRLAYIKNYVGTTFGGYDNVEVSGNTVTGLVGGATVGCPSSPTDNDCAVFFSSNTGDSQSTGTMGHIEVFNNSFRGDGSANVTGVGIAGAVADASVHGNNLVKLGNAVLVSPDTQLSPTSVSIKHNRLFADTNGVTNASDADVSAIENWWGCQTDPSAGGTYCSDAVNSGTGSIDVDPWIVTTAALSDTSVEVNGSLGITTDLRHLSDGSTVLLPDIFNGLATAFAAGTGSVDPAAGTLSATTLEDSSTYTAPATAGADTVTVTVDADGSVTGQPVLLPLTVTAAPDPGGDDDGHHGHGHGGNGDGDGGLPNTGASIPWWEPWVASIAVLLGAAIVWSGRAPRAGGRRKLA